MGEGEANNILNNDSEVIMEEDAIPVIDIDSSSQSSPEKPTPATSGNSGDPAELRGMPKSGRFWKQPKQRASSIKKHKRDSLEKKLKDRMDRKQTQELSKTIREQLVEKKRLKREREAEGKKRREENARKSEIVQKINNTAKLKKMKKKQLRFIEKRDTTDMK